MARGQDTRNHPSRRPTPRLAQSLAGYLTDNLYVQMSETPTLAYSGYEPTEVTPEQAQTALNEYRRHRDAGPLDRRPKDVAGMQEDIRSAVRGYR